MGVPKFFRWLSERYPKINQPIECPPKSTTRDKYFQNGNPITPTPYRNNNISSDIIDPTIPEFDRLYIDMNGIIHGCSHNNADQNNDDGNQSQEGITEEEIFANISYYLDRIVSDIAKPKELIYIAIDGVAPRAKMNQQRSRRFRSGKEHEIALIQKMKNDQKQAEERKWDEEEDDDDDEFIHRNDLTDEDRIIHQEMGIYYHPKSNKHTDTSDLQKGSVTMEMDDNDDLIATSNGRFAGTIQTGKFKKKKNSNDSSDSFSTHSSTAKSNENVSKSNHDDDTAEESFHHNAITPGTPFLCRCSDHIQNFIRHKLTSGDPAWKNLKIIFSGPNVPGEGEHKIMDFIRKEQKKQEQNQNNKKDIIRHCLMGQDGDLIMLGLATHEINFCLLREEVVFGQKSIAPPPISQNDNTQSPLLNSTQSSVRQYTDNSKFQLLHLNILRDYLAYEFETKDVVPYSPFHLEPTIDDFVFLTFFVGNDFLPHMPALDIGDGAFDLLFRWYKINRYRWVNKKDKKKRVRTSKKYKKNKVDENHPYLTRSGDIVDGKRLETFLMDVGRHEDPYYNWKKSNEDNQYEKLRNLEIKSGKSLSIPSKEERENQETENRQRYKEMLEKIAIKNANETDISNDQAHKLKPVMTSKSLPTVRFVPEEDTEEDDGLFSQFANLVSVSLSPSSKKKKSQNGLNGQYELDDFDMSDLKGRYYYDKFKFTPLDIQKHQALRKAYIEGLVWNLKYYYQGCVSWEWYYPYHYGPMLSDLNNIKSILHQIKFEKGKPLHPFEQLLACMPPNSAHVLPKPYRFLMTDKEKSPIVDYYPEDFAVDMNGKHFPWEAVVLLPFIDSKKLVNAVETLVDLDSLSDDERKRNSFENSSMLYIDEGSNSLKEVIIDEKNTKEVFYTIPKYLTQEHNTIDYLCPGFTTLRTVPITGLERKKIRLNIFGTGSRYRTSVLKMGDFPYSNLPPLQIFAKKFIGTTMHFRYPHFREGFVTAVSNMNGSVRGSDRYRAWSNDAELSEWKTFADKAYRSHERGDGTVGSGGWHLPSTDEEGSDTINKLKEEENYENKVIVTLRPLSHLQRLDNGEIVKIYDREEIRIPLIAALWTPHQIDPRLLDIRARLEKDPFDKRMRGGDIIIPNSVVEKVSKENENLKANQKPSASGSPLSVLPEFTSNISSGILPPLGMTNQTNPITSSLKSINELPPLSAKKYSSASMSFHLNKLHSLSTRGQANLCNLMTPIGKKRNLSSFSQLSLIERKKYVHHSNSTLNYYNRTRFGTRNKGIATVFAVLASSLFASSNSMWQPYTDAHQPSKGFHFVNKHHKTAKDRLPSSLFELRCGESYPYNDNDSREDYNLLDDTKTPPPLEFAHGTTTISFIFRGGIVAAVDSRASMGNFVGSKTTQKVLPINKYMLGTMAGGAADCTYWIRKLQSYASLHALTTSQSITVARASRILSDFLYQNRQLDLSVGTMIMGYDARGASIYYVDNTGLRLGGDLFAVGSGSTFALGILDTVSREERWEMSKEEAVELGIKAIRHATFRDAFSGGYIGVYLITKKDGWKKVFSEDLASVSGNDKLEYEDTLR